MKKMEKLFLFLFISVIMLIPISLPSIIQIRKIECESQYGSCNSSVNEMAVGVEKTNLRETKKRLKNVLSGSIYVKEFRLHYTYPDIMAVTVLERSPDYAMSDSSGSRYLLLDRNGYILSAEEKTNLPTIVSEGIDFAPGEQITSDKLFALQIVRAIYSNYPPKSAKLENSSLLVELEDDLKIIFPLEGDRDALVGSMFFILSRLKEEEIAENSIEAIDLRYKSPVISLKN